MPERPKKIDCCDKKVSGQDLAPLEDFIRLFEPDDEIVAFTFRVMLALAIASEKT
jgi:hypothetical protein